MNKTLSTARQIEFDTGLVKQIKQLESLASQGSYATFIGDEESLTVIFHNGKHGEIETRRRFLQPCAAKFSFTIAGKEIMDILKCFDEVTVTVRESSLSFKSGHAKMNRNLSTEAPEPAFPDFSKVIMSPLPQTTFRDAAFASYAAATNDNNDAAQRISVHLKDDEISIVASNGLMAVRVASPASYDGEEQEYLLHPRFINPLAPLTMREDAPAIYIGSTENKYCLRFGEIEITSRIPVSKSVKESVEDGLANANQYSAMAVTFPTHLVKTYLDRAKLLDVGTMQIQPVVLKIDTAENIVYAKHASALGDMQDMFDVEIEGSLLPDMLIGFSHKYMSEVFSRVRCDKARLSIRSQSLPVTVIEEFDETVVTHILLPVSPKFLKGVEQQEDTAQHSPSVNAPEVNTTNGVGLDPSDFE